MFKFLKDKLKKAVSIFSKKVEEEAEIKEEIREEEIKPEIQEPVRKEIKEEIQEEIKEEPEVSKPTEAEEEKLPEAEPEPEIPVEKEEEKKEEAIVEEKKEITEEAAKIEEPEKVEEAQEEVPAEEPVEQQPEEKQPEKTIPEFKEEAKAFQEEKQRKLPFFKRIFGKKEEKTIEAAEAVKKEAIIEKKLELTEIRVEKETKPRAEPKKEEKEEKAEKEEEYEEKKGFFRRIKETFTTVKLSEEKFEKLFWELELVLMENNVAVEVIDKIKSDLKADLTTGKVSRKGVEELILDSLRDSVKGLFIDNDFNIIDEIKKKASKPYIISFIGVNGSGKTTTMAKIARLLQKNNLSVVFAASDTFRAAAIQQLQEHADKLGVKMIRHDYESDPAAVAFDAIQHAKSKGIDVVLIDTAGRLHVNDNLMNELKKLIRVNKPDLKIFVGESITGNDCVEQAKLFNEVVGIDAIILAKADVDEKGGAAVSVSYVTKKPIIYLGTGQKYDDLQEFKPEIIIKNIGL
jgi:fused signal recognition particle receptor